MGARAARPPGRVPTLRSTTCPIPSAGPRSLPAGRRSANGAGDRPPGVAPALPSAATSCSQAPSRPPDRRRSDRSSGPRRRLLRRRFSCLPTHARLCHRPGRCDTDFSHLDCRSVLILIVALHRRVIELDALSCAEVLEVPDLQVVQQSHRETSPARLAAVNPSTSTSSATTVSSPASAAVNTMGSNSGLTGCSVILAWRQESPSATRSLA